MSLAERVTNPVIDPLNLTWIIPAEGSTDQRFSKADPSGPAFFVVGERKLTPNTM